MFSGGATSIDLRDILVAVENGDWDTRCKAMVLLESACHLGLIQEPQILETTNAMRHAYSTLRDERKFQQGVYMVTIQTGEDAGLTLINSTTNWGQDRSKLEKEGEFWIPVVFINLPKIKDKKQNAENLTHWLNWSCDQFAMYRTNQEQVFRITNIDAISQWVKLLINNVKELQDGSRGLFYIPLVDPESAAVPRPPTNMGQFAYNPPQYQQVPSYGQQQYGGGQQYGNTPYGQQYGGGNNFFNNPMNPKNGNRRP